MKVRVCMNNNKELLEEIISIENMKLAIKQVKKNKGSAGVDGIVVEKLDRFSNERILQDLINTIRNGKYKPSPVKVVEIPKDDGGVRMLGIPTVYDRVVQQAINQILTKIFDPQFSNYSYGFRQNISAHDALIQAEKYVREGREYIVDIDLSKYFDTINKDKLMALLKLQIKDRNVLLLISKFLKSGMSKSYVYYENKTGVPQGSPLSPLLSNIYLDVLDKELEKRNVKFCRYADDIQIYATSLRGAYRQMENTIKVIEGKKLKLKVNVVKSDVKTIETSKFLGYTFRRNKKGIIELAIH